MKMRRTICDLGDRGMRTEGTTVIITPDALKGKTGSTRSRLRAALRRRQVVEATIGHLKFPHHMGWDFDKGIIGDQMNILLAAAGHNFRRWLRFYSHLIQTASVCSSSSFAPWSGSAANRSIQYWQ
jgi:IS5 family transposase